MGTIYRWCARAAGRTVDAVTTLNASAASTALAAASIAVAARTSVRNQVVIVAAAGAAIATIANVEARESGARASRPTRSNFG